MGGEATLVEKKCCSTNRAKWDRLHRRTDPLFDEAATRPQEQRLTIAHTPQPPVPNGLMYYRYGTRFCAVRGRQWNGNTGQLNSRQFLEATTWQNQCHSIALFIRERLVPQLTHRVAESLAVERPVCTSGPSGSASVSRLGFGFGRYSDSFHFFRGAIGRDRTASVVWQ